MSVTKKTFVLPNEGIVAKIYPPHDEHPDLALIRFDFIDKSNPLCVKSTPVYTQALVDSFKVGDKVDLSAFTVIEKDCSDDRLRLWLVPKSDIDTLTE